MCFTHLAQSNRRGYYNIIFHILIIWPPILVWKCQPDIMPHLMFEGPVWSNFLTRRKMVKHWQKGEKKVRVMKPPQLTGVLRENPCKHCIFIWKCVGCALVKMKCDEKDGEENAENLKRQKIKMKVGVKKDKWPAISRPTKTQATIPAILEDFNLLTISPICSSFLRRWTSCLMFWMGFRWGWYQAMWCIHRFWGIYS